MVRKISETLWQSSLFPLLFLANLSQKRVDIWLVSIAFYFVLITVARSPKPDPHQETRFLRVS